MATGLVPVTIADLPEDGLECPICGVAYGESDDDGRVPPEEAVRLDCGNNHVFGRACITTWLTDTNVNQSARTCPTDRNVLFHDRRHVARHHQLWQLGDPREDESPEEALHFRVARRVTTMISTEADAYNILNTVEMASRKMEALFSSAQLGVSLRIARLRRERNRYPAGEWGHPFLQERNLHEFAEVQIIRAQLRSTIEVFERCFRSRGSDGHSSRGEARFSDSSA